MKKIFFFFLVLNVVAFGQEIFNFTVNDTLKLVHLHYSYMQPELKNSRFLFNGIDFNNNSNSAFFNYELSTHEMIQKNQEFIFADLVEGYIVSEDFQNYKKSKLSGQKTILKYDGLLDGMIVYQNDIAFVRRFMSEEHYITKGYDFANDREFDLPFGGSEYYGEVNDISIDRQVLLISAHYEYPSTIRIWDIQKKIDLYTMRYRSNRSLRTPLQFITNSLYILVPHEISDEYWEVYSLNGSLIDRFRFINPDGKDFHYIKFSPDLRYAIASNQVSNTKDEATYILDTSEFRKYFEDRGLLFEQTTATLNDTHVRVRQYANLEAKHMGFLEKGDRVQVLDCSALKRTIDPWGEHYWYQIKRESDGLEGWTFGAFLDFEG